MKFASLVLLIAALMAGIVQAQTVTGDGTAGTVPQFTGSSQVGNSPISVSGGNVGIGTTNPPSPLSVGGQIAIGTPFRGDASLHINQSYGGFGRYIQIQPLGPSQNALNLIGSSDNAGDYHWFSWGVNSGVWSINPGIAFGESGLNVDGRGNVGIGTTSPQYKLDVNGAIRFSSGGIVFPDGSTQTTAYNSATAAQSTFSANSLQSVGNGDGAGEIDLINTAKTANGIANRWSIYNMTGVYGNSLQFWNYDSIGCTSGGMCSPRLTIMDSGNVGIGTTNPPSLLSVGGQIAIGTPFRGDASLHINQSYGGFGRYIQIQPLGPSQNALNLIGSSDNAGDYHWFSWGVNSGVWSINPGIAFGESGLNVDGRGNVGIGTTSPSQKLEVAGYIQTDAGIYFPGNSTPQTQPYTGVLCGGDYAETVDVAGDRKNYEPGDVLVIGQEAGSDVLKSSEPYSTLVVGVYSTKPGVVGRRQTTDPKISTTEVPMAMIGIVPTKVSAENGPIKRGDLLVTSSTAGYAMKGTDRSRLTGAVIGKALGSLDSGTGMIEVVVTLQ